MHVSTRTSIVPGELRVRNKVPSVGWRCVASRWLSMVAAPISTDVSTPAPTAVTKR